MPWVLDFWNLRPKGYKGGPIRRRLIADELRPVGGYQPSKAEGAIPPPPKSKKELQMKLGDTPDPPPTPEVAPAVDALKELHQAIERATKAWNRTQLIDAMRSVKYWTGEVEQAAKIVDLT